MFPFHPLCFPLSLEAGSRGRDDTHHTARTHVALGDVLSAAWGPSHSWSCESWGLEREVAKGAGPSWHPGRSGKLNSDLVAEGVQFKGGMWSEVIGRGGDAERRPYLLSADPLPVPCHQTAHSSLPSYPREATVAEAWLRNLRRA